MADKIKLLELDIDVEAIIAKSAQLKATLDGLRAQQDALKKSGDTNSETYVKLSAQINKISSDYSLNQKQLANLTQVNGDYLTVQQKVALALDKEATGITEAREQNASLLKIRNQLNLSKEDEAKLAAAINQKLDENTKFIKSNVSQNEQRIMGIGDYKNAILEATKESSSFGEKTNQLKAIHESLKVTYEASKEKLKEGVSTIKEFTAGTEGMSTAQKAGAIATNLGSGALQLFKVALASTGIGLLIIAVAALIGYFTETQEGIDKLNGVLQPLKAIFGAIIGVLETLGGKLVDTFTNPKKAMTDLVEFVEQNLINRFKAFGVILDGIVNLDFKKVVNGALQAGTGVENLTDKVSSGAKEAGKFLDENARKGAEIARLTKEAEEAQLDYNKAQLAVKDAINDQLLISKDTSRSFKERAAAAEEIISITEKNAKQEQAILNLKLQQLQIEHSLKGEKNLTIEDKQKELDLLTQIHDSEEKGKETRIEQSKVLSGLKKEERQQAEDNAKKEQELRQSVLDSAAKSAKLELDIYLSLQGNKKKSIEEELLLAEHTFQSKIEIAKKEYEASKKTTEDKLQLQLDENNATQELLKKQSDIVVSNSEHELKLFLDANKSKLDANKFLTEELVNQELDRINRVSEAEAESATNKLVAGAINEQEYQDAIKVIDDKADAEKKKTEELYALEKTKQIETDLENQNAIANSELGLKLNQLEKKRIQEIKEAEKTGADVNLINKKYEILKNKTEQESEAAHLAIVGQSFTQIGSLFNEQTAAAKIFGIAGATINTYAAIAGQLAAFSSIPIPGYAIAQAIATGAVGFAQVAKIAGLKLATGGIDIDGPGSGTSDSIPAMLSKGESVITAEKTAMFKPLLEAIHNDTGISYDNKGNAYPTSVINTFQSQASQTNTGIDYDLLAVKISQANASIPNPILELKDFHIQNNKYQKSIDYANH